MNGVLSNFTGDLQWVGRGIKSELWGLTTSGNLTSDFTLAAWTVTQRTFVHIVYVFVCPCLSRPEMKYFHDLARQLQYTGHAHPFCIHFILDLYPASTCIMYGSNKTLSSFTHIFMGLRLKIYWCIKRNLVGIVPAILQHTSKFISLVFPPGMNEVFTPKVEGIHYCTPYN